LLARRRESRPRAPRKCPKRKQELEPQGDVESGSGKEFIKCDI
jgi:hypothetical protein